MKRILIVEDDPMARSLLELIVTANEHYTLVGSIESALMAESYCLKNKVDLIIMDVCTSFHASGLEAAAKIKKQYPAILIIMITSQPEWTFIRRAKEIGVESFWYKTMDKEDLVEVIEKTLAGGCIYPEAVPKIALGNAFNYDFSERQLEVLRELTTGDTDEVIGKRLHLSVWTIRRYVKEMLEITGFESRTRLAVEASMLGIVLKNY